MILIFYAIASGVGATPPPPPPPWLCRCWSWFWWPSTQETVLFILPISFIPDWLALLLRIQLSCWPTIIHNPFRQFFRMTNNRRGTSARSFWSHSAPLALHTIRIWTSRNCRMVAQTNGDAAILRGSNGASPQTANQFKCYYLAHLLDERPALRA